MDKDSQTCCPLCGGHYLTPDNDLLMCDSCFNITSVKASATVGTEQDARTELRKRVMDETAYCDHRETANQTDDVHNSALDANTNLLSYVLQDDIHNRLTPRVIDIAYTAFMQAKRPNDEDGGASDWFNDTKPVITALIAKLRKDLHEETRKSQPSKHLLCESPSTKKATQFESPRPWRITKAPFKIVDANGKDVARLSALDAANAELIVRAVNVASSLSLSHPTGDARNAFNTALEKAAELCELWNTATGSRLASEISSLKLQPTDHPPCEGVQKPCNLCNGTGKFLDSSGERGAWRLCPHCDGDTEVK